MSTVAERNYEAGLRATWLKLEDYKAMKPLPTGRCRECGVFRAPGPLCLDCNDTRLRLKERFNLFPIPENTVETLNEVDRVKPDTTQPTVKVSSSEPPYRFPYKDPED